MIDFKLIFANEGYGMWILVAYATVALAMVADMVAGIGKSKRLGRPCTSRGLKQTCDKAMQYFLPMLVLSCIDLLASQWCRVPVLTHVYAAFCLMCEVVSVCESTGRKESIRRTIAKSRDLMDVWHELNDLIGDIKCCLPEDGKEEGRK